PISLSTRAAPTVLYTPSLHDALPICGRLRVAQAELRLCDHIRERSPQLVRELGSEALLVPQAGRDAIEQAGERRGELSELVVRRDRKSTRLNSSHVKISYAVFCLKKK